MFLYPEISIRRDQSLSLDKFREMDYYAVENYDLPIELMMENAGLHLAKLVSKYTIDKSLPIVILVGSGNNGGGGSVAARRLAAWGYKVNIKLISNNLKGLPAKQFERAIKFGVINELPEGSPQLIVDAMLGFSQKPPLRDNIVEFIEYSNKISCVKISLDLPTGLFDENSTQYFEPTAVLSLAAPKEIFFLPQLKRTYLYVADLGIPKAVYDKFNKDSYLKFNESSIYKIKIDNTTF